MAFSRDLTLVGRSWRQHFGMQFATFVVLAATMSVVAFMLSFSMNLKRVLTVWGERVQVSVYLDDGISPKSLDALREEIKAMPQVADVEYVTKKMAANLFRDQMASYAPDLLEDSEFATPFPASLQVRLKEGASAETRVEDLEAIAAKLTKRDGVEDVSYGQSWVKNYASFVMVLQAVGGVIGAILLMGGIFVIGNAIRASIASRREEIEIMELVGATASMIRRPFIVEGAVMAAIAATVALIVNAVLFQWQLGLMKTSFAFARMAAELQFLSVAVIFGFIFGAMCLGALGAWATVRSLNDGWAAARGVGAKA